MFPHGVKGLACIGACGAALFGLNAAGAAAAGAEVRLGPAPQLPAGSTLVAGLANVRTMALTVALAPRDPVALQSYAFGVADPRSPEYHHYLSPGEFRAQFAPARSTLVRVEAELRRHGLQPGAVSANGLAIQVHATSAAVEHAFSLTLSRVRLPDGRDALVNSQAPALDADVARAVQAIIGLNSLARMQRLDARAGAVARARAGAVARAQHARAPRVSSAHVATGGPRPCVRAAQVAPGQGAYTADQIASAYGFADSYRQGDLGQGVTVGIYELEPNSASDVAAYQKCYRTATRVSYVKVDGGAGAGSGQGEAALDIEQLVGLVPKAKLIVYEGPNNNSDTPGTGPYDTLAAMVSQDRAQVLTNSWGECEPLEGVTDAHAESTLLQEAAAQGQTFVSAAGDSGAEDCWTPPPGGSMNNSLAVDDPASQVFATAIGGTSLNPVGPPPVESVWNDDNPAVDYARFGVQQGAGGGGLSWLWAMPSYQSSATPALGVLGANSSATPCGAPAGAYCRELPDVSADADPLTPYLDYWNGSGSQRGESGWQGTGGTSGAAPVWAALFALADASRTCRGSLVGFANAELYALASESQATYFNDVTSGNNDFTPSGNTSGLYPAAAGYDLASGLGTPRGSALIPGLCRQAVRVLYPGEVYTFFRQRVLLRLRATLADGQAGPVTFRATRLPAGLHLNATTGVISGTVRRLGARTVTITASTPSQTYGAVQFAWTVERRPQVVAAVAGSRAGPALTVTAQSGQYEPGLREVVVRLPANLDLAVRASSVSVVNPANRPLAHSARFARHVLTIRLAVAHSPVRVLFAPGALRVTGALAGTVTVSVKTVDRAGGHLTLSRVLSGA